MTNSQSMKDFRTALGQFATGVTVVTCREPGDKMPIGVTASSFNSVSLDPPMVLWALAKSAFSLPAFMDSAYFCVHVLSDDQKSLSRRFACQGLRKFQNLQWTPGRGGVPMLEEFSAQFVCRTCHRYEGGDHIIFVGEVVQFKATGKAPLIFHDGKYARISRYQNTNRSVDTDSAHV